MESISWFVPILPGKLDAWKQFTEESNARMEEHAESRRRAGITRELAALVQTPQGDFTSVFLEGENIGRAFQTMLASEAPYDKWFIAKTEEVHGMTRETYEGPLPVTVMFDYRGDAATAGRTEHQRQATVSSDTD
ncbi:MAG TPA: hypothetical protein VLO00_06285 [Cryobacterium sp.]|nr:hypothetical protein [Cryobacterium sp.]